MANNPTIIAAKLSDEELKASINKLVQHVDDGTKKMAKSIDDFVSHAQKALQGIGNININLGNVGGSGANQTKVAREIVKGNEEVVTSYKRIAQASQMAAEPPKSARESYIAFMKGYKEQANQIDVLIKKEEELILKRQEGLISKQDNSIVTYKKQISELQDAIHKLYATPQEGQGWRQTADAYRQEIERLKQKISEAQKEIVKLNNEPLDSNRLQNLITMREKVLSKMRDESTEQKRINEAQSITTQQTKQQIEDAEKLTKKIQHQADIVRQRMKESGYGFAQWGNAVIYDPQKNKSINLSIEEQLLQLHKASRQEIERRNAAIEREKQLKQETVAQTHQQIQAEQQVSQAQQQRSSKTVAKTFKDYEDFRGAIAQVLGMQRDEIRLADAQNASYNKLSESLKLLQRAYNKLTASERESDNGKALAASMHELQRAIQLVQQQATRPTNLENVLGIKPTTIDDIAFKIRKLQEYKRGIDLTKPNAAQEIERVDNAIKSLEKDLRKYTTQAKQANDINNALSRSWNYMKNRLAFYFTVGASTQFVKNLIDIRAQYEMNERALGILINSAERGSQIFKELSNMALVSPYTLIELSTAAKQLTAYDVAARDVVDTTRRLADMTAAVGIPIERLTYALGQIKAYGYLNARDARMFSNAGIPLVKQLSDYYTELEGKMVSVADIYDRIKKKAIGYNDVMQVINKMTDEGGKFFDFQAKMADTLKVRLANLTLAWNNMLNDIGKSHQGLLTSTIGVLRDLFLHWKQVNSAINGLLTLGAITVGVRALNFVLYRLQFSLWGLIKPMTATQVAGKAFANVMRTIYGTLRTVVTSPLTWWGLAAAAIMEMVFAVAQANDAQKEFNKTLRESAQDNYNNITKFLEQYSVFRSEIEKSQQATSVDVNKNTQRKLSSQQTNNSLNQVGNIQQDEAKKIWEAVKEQIELTTRNADEYIGRLLTINDVSERVRQGFQILDEISVVNAAIKDMDDDVIKITNDWSKWWNLYTLPDGLVENLKQVSRLSKDIANMDTSNVAKVVGDKANTQAVEQYRFELEQLQKDLKTTTDSILAFINLKGWSSDANKIGEVFTQVLDKIAQESNLDPSTVFTLQLQAEESRTKAIKQALQARIDDENAALKSARDENLKADIQARLDALNAELSFMEKNTDTSRVYWRDFTKWMKEQHISEITAMFRNMDAEQIRSLDFTKGKYFNWVDNLAKKYAKEHNMAYSDVFTQLRNYVQNANQWSIFIPLTIGTSEEKSLYDTLKEADSEIDTAFQKIQRLNTRKAELERMGGSMSQDEKVAKDYEKVLKEISDAQKDYNNALAKGGHSQKEDAKNKRNATQAAKAQKEAESELQRALKEELSLIDKVRSTYKTLTKDGVDMVTALKTSTSGFDESVTEINKTFQKFGLQKLDLAKYAGLSNPRDVMNMLQSQLDTLIKSNKAKPSEIKDLQVKLKDLKVDAITFDHKKITDGLNSELGKIKDEYELAVELDANPELGDMFADVMNIDRSALPQTFGEAFDRANAVVRDKLHELGVELSDFDLLGTIVKPDENNRWMGLDVNSDPIKDIVKWQKTYQDIFKKNMSDTEKMLDDYVKKYGDFSDKIAEIERDRLERVRKLNEAYYNEQMRSKPEYITKLNAINSGAQREKQKVEFDAFKESRYYTAMFENLDFVSTRTIRDIRDRLREMMESMNQLSPEQLKHIMTQYEKLEQKLIKRSPFKTLAKDFKDYVNQTKDRKAANLEFQDADKKYRAQQKLLAGLKEEYERQKSISWLAPERIESLQKEITDNEEILRLLKEQLDAAQKKADKYNLTAKLAKSEAAQVAQVVAVNLQSLSALRDNLQETFGFEFGEEINSAIDGLKRVGDGISGVYSSAQSGDIFGVANGVVNIFAGLGDGIASLFGDGAARTKKIQREIEKSEDAVRELNMAYKELERTVNNAMGAEELRARRSEIANKKAELAEIQRQLQLEKSKRKKDRDDEKIKDYTERIQDLQFEINDIISGITETLLGGSIKSAAEDFVSTWVSAWRQGEDTMEALNTKFDDMIDNMIAKSVASYLVSKRLQTIFDAIDDATNESSEGSAEITMNELKRLRSMIGDTSIAEQINQDLTNLYNALDIAYGVNGDTNKNLSALQQGIQGVTEETAGALEAYMNGVSQQVYLHSDLLTQIRDAVVSFDVDVQTATMGEILLQLQSSYQVQQAIQSTLEGWSSPNGMAVRVELQ